MNQLKFFCPITGCPGDFRYAKHLKEHLEGKSHRPADLVHELMKRAPRDHPDRFTQAAFDNMEAKIRVIMQADMIGINQVAELAGHATSNPDPALKIWLDKQKSEGKDTMATRWAEEMLK